MRLGLRCDRPRAPSRKPPSVPGSSSA